MTPREVTLQAHRAEAAQDERLAIVRWIEAEGDTFGPDVESKASKCPHGRYGWEDCDQCTVRQIIDGINEGAPHNERGH